MSNRKLREREQKASPLARREVCARLNLSEAQLRQLLALSGASLVETMRAAQELADRVTLLREVIETLLAEGRPKPSPRPIRFVDVRDILDAKTFKP